MQSSTCACESQQQELHHFFMERNATMADFFTKDVVKSETLEMPEKRAEALNFDVQKSDLLGLSPQTRQQDAGL